ncbi:M15 family metallopeptidase [Mycobacterium sp. Z3061]|uniref:M15 family metallopeptidase n=1 Tax=Mycobacterium sp. Z3061 TaxID=3073562 RepID=UPI002873BF5E|nr:M15 family metallopeptidase [Mycobacterium sp. Z3061]
MFARIRAVVGVVALWAVAAPVARADPVAPADFVVLQDVDPSIEADIRYYTAHNFTGERVDGYRAPLCLLTRAAADGLRRAQQLLTARGYTLKVYDCYRPQRAVDEFVRWASDVADQRMKAEFYPRVDKSVLFRDGYIDSRSGHSRGSTVDLTVVRLPGAAAPPYVPGQPLVDCTAPAPERFPDDSIDMGSGFDCFDPVAHTLDIQGEQLSNRLLLKDVLQGQGFVNYAAEWWHYTYQPEPYPDTYFDFPIDRSSLG